MKHAFAVDCALRSFPGPGNIYKLNLAQIVFWSMEARQLTQAVQSSGSSFGSSCTQFSFASADMTLLL